MIGLLMCRSEWFKQVQMWLKSILIWLNCMHSFPQHHLNDYICIACSMKQLWKTCWNINEMSLCAYYYLMLSFIREVNPGKLHFYFSFFLFIPVLKAECQTVGAAAGREVDRPVHNNETTSTCAWIHAQRVSVRLTVIFLTRGRSCRWSFSRCCS